MALEWRLRRVMAEKNIWSGAELGRLLPDLRIPAAKIVRKTLKSLTGNYHHCKCIYTIL